MLHFLIHFYYIDCSLPTVTSMYVAAFNGTIKLNDPKSVDGFPKNCVYKIVAAYPNTNVSLTCTSKAEKNNFVVSLCCHSSYVFHIIIYRIQESYIIQ